MDNTIRVERAKLDISQQDLAEKVNVSRQTIHSIERGKKIPSVELAIRIAQFFKVSVESYLSIDFYFVSLKILLLPFINF